MAQLAIKGHSTRGEEVIRILEMLGGKNYYEYNGEAGVLRYYIDKNGYIGCDKEEEIPFPVHIFTLEDFLEKFPYEIGNKVIDMNGLHGKIVAMSWDECNCTVRYALKYEGSSMNHHGYTALMLNPIKEELIKQPILIPTLDLATGEILYFTDKITNKKYYPNEPSDLSMECPDGFEFIDENGNVLSSKKIKLERKKPQYPKTYKECCKIVGFNIEEEPTIFGYKDELLTNFQHLLICRDAYWKIAVDWKPDWLHNDIKYILDFNAVTIYKDAVKRPNYVLAFPTEEMRDNFYENFKELIESCKELL